MATTAINTPNGTPLNLLATNILYQKTIEVFDGDSLTTAHAVGGSGQVYFLTNRFLPPYTQWSFGTNCALDGEQFHTMLANFTNNILPWMPDQTGTNAMVTAWGGVNDNGSQTAAQTILDVSNYVNLVHLHGGKSTVLTIPTASNWAATNIQYQQTVNAFIRNYTNIDYVVDVARIFPTFNAAWVIPGDNVHFNTNSDFLIAGLIFAALAQPPHATMIQGGDFNVGQINSYKGISVFSTADSSILLTNGQVVSLESQGDGRNPSIGAYFTYGGTPVAGIQCSSINGDGGAYIDNTYRAAVHGNSPDGLTFRQGTVTGTVITNGCMDFNGPFFYNYQIQATSYVIHSNAWNVASITNHMANFDSAIASSNGVPVVLYLSNGVPYVNYLSTTSEGIIP
jgi:hypothetical protein